jgi:hypothetical protein
MGFRDLKMFNLAMLDKQGWRLTTRPDSLCTKVLKGRYFHDGDFMSCSRRRRASSTWRAILAGREVLRKGLVKRVCDGLTTRIWHDRWMLGHFTGRPLTPAEGQDVEKVSDLITDSGAWNEGLIRDIFYMTTFPTCFGGVFYMFHQKSRNCIEDTSNLLPIVKHVGQMKNQYVRHALVECTVARMFWEETKKTTGVKLPCLRQDSWAIDLLQDNVFPRKDRVVIICGTWSLWMLRNRHRHGEARMPIRQAVMWVSDTASDLWQLLHPQKEQTPKVLPRWKPPEEDWIKCNPDGAFYPDGSGATGAVLRDHHGCFKGGSTRWYDTCMDALTMEALACRDGVILAKKKGATRVLLETDCQELVRLWSMKDEERSSVTTILREIQELCNSLVKFLFV